VIIPSLGNQPASDLFTQSEACCQGHSYHTFLAVLASFPIAFQSPMIHILTHHPEETGQNSAYLLGVGHPLCRVPSKSTFILYIA